MPLSQLPKMDKLLKDPLFKNKNPILLKQIAQKQIATLRQALLDNDSLPPYENILQEILKGYEKTISLDIKPLINASGVILQTNLGRSIFSQELLAKIFPLLSEYNNLEYDIIQGKRGERYAPIVKYLCTLFGCEDALVVNNNASALLLIINTFAKDKEVIVSRGELVEIGGSFRIPEIITSAGGILKEVGSTNKTHLKDYEEAIASNSALLLKAHQSNFKQIGFTKEVSLQDLIALAKKHRLIDYYDLGSGYITDIDGVDEPNLLKIAKLKPSLVSFSGDKLLGGPQAGIIFGKKSLIAKLKKNHLLRALRIDKFSLFALAETLKAYLENNLELIPTLSMLRVSQKDLLQKAQKLFTFLENIPNLNLKITPLKSKAGGGALPDKEFPSYGIALKHKAIKTQILNERLRQKGIIARIQSDRVLLDVRCLNETHFFEIQKILEVCCG